MSKKALLSKLFVYILSAMTLLSCGKNTEEKVADATTSANILLSTRQCQAAIDLLESVGRQNKNAYYLKTLSSAYACRANYSTIKFFADDIALTSTPSPLGGMATYSTSQATIAAALSDDTKFQDLQRAIDILLYAGGIATTTEPTISERAKYFSANQAGDINSQLLFMLLAQTGKLMKYYADSGTTGVKGSGSGANNCFTDYTTTPAAVQTYVASLPGACTVTNSSHPDLAIGATDRRKRLCQGVVLMNALLEILPSVVATASGGDMASISTIANDIQNQKDLLTTNYPAIGVTATVMSQANCEASASIDFSTLTAYYAIIYEALIN